MSGGCLIGALGGAYTSDWWGRRKNLVLGIGIFMFGGSIQITASRNWLHMLLGRFTAGLGLGNLSLGVPMFQSESAPREIRGAVVASYQLFITLGIFFCSSIGEILHKHETNDWAWRILIGVGMILSIPIGIGIMTVPESPRWLAGQGDWEAARHSLARLRGLVDKPDDDLIEDDINEMREVLDREALAGKGSWVECFRNRSGSRRTVYRTWLGIAIHFMQQWTGVNYFFYYGGDVFKAAGIQDPLQTQMILGGINCFMTLAGPYLVEKLGRRWPLFVGSLWQAACLAVFATVGHMHPPTTANTTGIYMIASSCLFIASFAATWGPMVWVVIGETFPLRLRAKQAALATAGNWFGNFMLGFITPVATNHIDYQYGFVFVASNLVAAVIVFFFLYETRMLSLESVDLLYNDMDVKAWNSAKWVPPGYITREERDVGHFRRLSVALNPHEWRRGDQGPRTGNNGAKTGDEGPTAENKRQPKDGVAEHGAESKQDQEG
ncbi:hypothetical protein CDD82_6532 [Ophiocordyceps australis]|uniref:Major facilitator superfamily (MFS) profile domain-containing protein n=1 Tax=Ophiocordyceps australis TaxID=1399860 RepID=A0A2C5XZX3_9HYPO|nr:hypothetical protein CDD82_6532 [Ophiocordyceps australis]